MKEKIFSKKVAIIAGICIAVLLIFVAIMFYINRDGSEHTTDQDAFTDMEENNESDADDNSIEEQEHSDENEDSNQGSNTNDNSADNKDSNNDEMEEVEDKEEPVMEPDVPDKDKWTAYY